MKLKTNIVFKDLDGKELKNRSVDEKTGKIKETDGIILGPWLAQLLVYGKTDNQYRAWFLAKKFNQQKEIELTAEDISFVKEMIKTSGSAPLVAGQAIEILEGNVE